MKTHQHKHTCLNTIVQCILFITMIVTAQSNFLHAQGIIPKGAQSSMFGNPYGEAYFSNPIIHGSTAVCPGQSTQLSVDSGYSSYAWSNGQTTRTTTVGAGTYTIMVSDAIGCTRSNTITVINDSCGLILNLSCYIQGYYLGSGLMAPVLMNQGVGSDPLICDSIQVELRQDNSPYSLVSVSQALLHTNGTAALNFQAATGLYYIAIRHRNGLYTWSASPVTFGSTAVNYSFTLNPGNAFGNNEIQVEPGIWALYTGDLNADENIDLLDASLLETGINNFEFGYQASDMNGDGNVDLLDSPIQEININNFIFSSHP